LGVHQKKQTEAQKGLFPIHWRRKATRGTQIPRVKVVVKTESREGAMTVIKGKEGDEKEVSI